jgi:hypothetical protein
MTVDVGGLPERVRQYALDRALTLGQAFVNAAQNNAPRRTGAGADSIAVDSVEETSAGIAVRVVVGEVYMTYQNEGTGIYGPLGVPIRPVAAKVLVFDSAVLGLVFATSVRGTEPTHWFDRTIDQWPAIVGDA